MTSEKHYTVFEMETGKGYENIFLACGFSEEEAAEMVAFSFVVLMALNLLQPKQRQL